MAKKNNVWKNLEKTLGQEYDDYPKIEIDKKDSNDYSWITNSGPKSDFEPLPLQTMT